LLLNHTRLTWVRYGETRVLMYFKYIAKTQRNIS